MIRRIRRNDDLVRVISSFLGILALITVLTVGLALAQGLAPYAPGDWTW